MVGLQEDLNLGLVVEKDHRVKHKFNLRLLDYLKLKEDDPNIIRMNKSFLSPNKELPDLGFTWEKVLDKNGN